MATILARVNTMSPATDAVSFFVDIVTDTGTTASITVEIPINDLKGNQANAALADTVKNHMITNFNVPFGAGDRMLLVGGIV